MIAGQQSKGMLSIERYTNTLNVFRVVGIGCDEIASHDIAISCVL